MIILRIYSIWAFASILIAMHDWFTNHNPSSIFAIVIFIFLFIATLFMIRAKKIEMKKSGR